MPIEFVVAVVADVDLIMAASFDIVLYVVEVVGVLIEFEGFVVVIENVVGVAPIEVFVVAEVAVAVKEEVMIAEEYEVVVAVVDDMVVVVEAEMMVVVEAEVVVV